MKQEVKKLLILNLPYLLFVYLFDKIGAAIRLTPGADASEKLLQLGTGFAAAFSSIAPSLHPADLLIGIAGAVIIRLAVYMKGKNAKKYRKGMEYGSARWGGAEDIKPYIDPVFENNVLLTQTERLMMSSRPKQPKYARNKNILVIGGSGSGKTRFFVKPNLMQMHSSYVVTDPKGTVLPEVGNALLKNGYRIKIFNTINFKKSMHYNPFAYVHDEKDILKLVTTLIANTKGEGKSNDEFWEKAEKLLYSALIGYIHYEAPEEEQNFSTLLEMINAMEVREDDEEFKNPVDLMFDELAERDPDHFAVRQYAKYKLSAGDVTPISQTFDKYVDEKQRQRIIENFPIERTSEDITLSYDQAENLHDAIVKGMAYPELTGENDEIDFEKLVDFMWELRRLFKWDIYEKKTIGKRGNGDEKSVIRWYCTILLRWIRGNGLNTIVRSAVRYKENNPWTGVWSGDYMVEETYNPNSKYHKNLVIAESLSVIENVLLFSISNYFRKFSMEYKAVHQVENFDNDWYEYVEYGTTNPITIFLQQNGFSREASIYIQTPSNYSKYVTDVDGEKKIKRSILECGNIGVETEAQDIQFNIPELFVE